MRVLLSCALLLVACGDDSAGTGGSGGTAGSGGASGSGGSGGIGGSGGGLLSDQYPGDIGIDNDPDVVWHENFEEGSVAAVTGRYDSAANPPGMTLSTDVPARSSGHASMQLTSDGGGANATDLYKNLGAGYDEIFVRYYAKYQAGVMWHHTGVWIGGYNPPSPYPNPMAGLKPNGDDRFSVSLEPMEAAPNARLDFYDYWMQMHSWMDVPMGSTAYYGNSLVHQTSLRAPDDTWFCVELHIKLNPDPTSPAGAELGLWINDTQVQDFTDSAPLGCWIKDKFCPVGADGPECTGYPSLCVQPYIPLDLQYRSTSALKINAFWPQNYITAGGAGSVWYDDMVMAKRRIGCLR